MNKIGLSHHVVRFFETIKPSKILMVGLLSFTLLVPASSSNADNISGGGVHKVAFRTGETSIAVIYPDIGEPYRTVFSQIIDGIKAKTPIVDYAVGANVDIDVLKNSLRQQNIKVVIALGRQGMKIASNLDSNIGVVVGGVIASPENEMHNLPVNSLSPDPALLFAQLKRMMPTVRRVFTVYDPHQNDWLIRIAKNAARTQNLELVVYEAQDLRGAVRFYQDIFAIADSQRDALWLLQDTTAVENGTVLPLVLQESWSRNLAVFSSNFGHVKRGVLFSLYPDNTELGSHLAAVALAFLASGDYGEHGMMLLREVLTAINLRTANHLGLNASHQQDFDLVFPEQ
ncbi:MAG: ABC transporter substrate binding protein [Methylococcales bacterium]|nr:ABC transporter substrate binding protein [Methylococcales bacterium]